MEARGALGRPFWDSSPLMTPIFITWTIPGHFFLVRAVPGAVPTAAASMDGSDGRPDGIPGAGKGLTTSPYSKPWWPPEAVERGEERWRAARDPRVICTVWVSPS